MLGALVSSISRLLLLTLSSSVSSPWTPWSKCVNNQMLGWMKKLVSIKKNSKLEVEQSMYYKIVEMDGKNCDPWKIQSEETSI